MRVTLPGTLAYQGNLADMGGGTVIINIGDLPTSQLLVSIALGSRGLYNLSKTNFAPDFVIWTQE